MKRVWLVEMIDYEGGAVLGVFSTQELAEAFAATENAEIAQSSRKLIKVVVIEHRIDDPE